MSLWLRRLFAASSLIFLVVLAISPAKNAFRQYRGLQAQFRRLGEARARGTKNVTDYARRTAGIQQIWLRDFDNRVDRCVTCHLGVADPLMENVPQPFGTHPRTPHAPTAFDRFGCTSCHGGQGLATVAADAHGTARDAGPPMTPIPYLEAGCGKCHLSDAVREAPVLSRGRTLMARAGCFACHAARGHESFRSSAPPLATVALKTGAGWLRAWLKDPKAVDPNATMPNFQLSDRDIEALSQYLFSLSAPEAIATRIQAAAQEPAGDAANGKKLFAESRCISCHTVEGKGNGGGPELSKIGSSITRGWLLAFVRDAQAFNPRTTMPRFHFSDEESRDVVEYLAQEMRDFDAAAGTLTPLRVNQTLAESGEKLFRRYGCVACHDASGTGKAEKFGPDLDGIGDKKAASLDFGRRKELPHTLAAWVGAKIEAPRSFANGLRMPAYGFNTDDTRAIVTALLSLAAQPVPETYQYRAASAAAFVPAGPVGALIDRYRCLSCHQIGGRGGDISTASLTFEGSKVRREWLVDYLMLSYTIRPILTDRMPVFRMPREEAVQLADMMESFYLDARIPEDPFAGRSVTEHDRTEGGRLYVTLGCRACHQMGSSGGYYGPPLTDAAKRLKPGWMFSWLKDPQKWRADVRCPNYGLKDLDALRLVAYLTGTRTSSATSTAAGAAP